MTVDSRFEEFLLRNLKLNDPWLPPKPWESISSESGGFDFRSSNGASAIDCIYDLSSVSEPNLVRLVLNSLMGVQSAVLSIKQLSTICCAQPADRSGHRIPTLWNRFLSTAALGKMLKSIGFSGSLVIFLQKFVDYYSCSSVEGSLAEKQQLAESEIADDIINKVRNMDHPPHSLVNQAFAVAVRKVLEGYIYALNTLNASVRVRRASDNVSFLSNSSQWQGSLSEITESEVTLLEIYLHTKELRTQIEGLGHLCRLHDAALCFSLLSSEDLSAKAISQFQDFPRGGDLLTYLYKQLQLVDPAHCSLLKFLFLRSLEPYCGFIRSWIYEAKIDDPYGEFIVEYGVNSMPYTDGKAGLPVDFPLANVKEQDGVTVPCFLQSVVVPLLRAGQQIQVVMRLLRLYNYVHAGELAFDDVLPGASDFMGDEVFCSPLSFNKGELQATVLSRRNFYCSMHKKLESIMENLDVKYRQVILHDSASVYASSGETLDFQYSSNLEVNVAFSTDKEDSNQVPEIMDSAASTDEDISFVLDPLESSECSSADDSEDQVDFRKTLKFHECLDHSEQKYLSTLCFSSLINKEGLVQSSQTERNLTVQNDKIDYNCGGPFRKNNVSCRESEELSRSLTSELQYAGNVPDLGWPIGGLLANPLKTGCGYRDDKNSQLYGSDPDMRSSGSQNLDAITSCSALSPRSVQMHEESDRHELSPSNSFIMQSWNAKYPWNVLSINPMLTRNVLNNYGESKSNFSRTFPCFDFSSAMDPFKTCQNKLPVDPRDKLEAELSSNGETSYVRNMDSYVPTQNNAGNIPVNEDHIDHASFSPNLRRDSIEVHLKNVNGGCSWQSLLHGSTRISDANVRDYDPSPDTVFQIPLDFIIDKCLLQEIMLQYIHVSRLTIKLLEEGFDLQGHFLALRRYHMMEIADWADLFITSLWHHKWYFMEPYQKIPEVQGLLELSVQRSSCERDDKKERLYVYVKDQDRFSFSTEAVGIQSFNFIGLGYKVDWPISIVLTPSALSIYAQIFTFLIQVKLAVLSLSDVWCSLKAFKHLFSQSTEKHQLARSNFNYLVKLRHQINHFVSTLQQYVLSQLSHVSWCKFRYALKHEVKDMMDLEAVHMAYLRDSMYICFLVDETVSISNNIENILQCALDFRLCLITGIEDVGSDNQGAKDGVSHIDISHAHSIKEKFYVNLKELYLMYLKLSKHEEYGLPRFWSCLDFNEYYSDAFGDEMSRYNLWVQ